MCHGRGWMGSVSFCGMTAGGRQFSKGVRPIAQWEIPAYAGMTWVCAGMTWVCAGMTWVCAGMTWVCAGMTWVCAGMTGLGGNDVGVCGNGGTRWE